MRLIFLSLILFMPVLSTGQVIFVPELQPGEDKPVSVSRLAGDSLVTSFVIFIKDEVKSHRHNLHSEHVYVLEGNAEMWLNGKRTEIGPGSLVFIPKGTVHRVKVTGNIPLKVLSVQAPEFDGTDREYTD